ncbi:MAG: VOC family protein [Phycisphaerales bacterium]|nr:MAG: VOC family protein [Phycisphaerales bacterium]
MRRLTITPANPIRLLHELKAVVMSVRYTHTNLIAQDRERLVAFYETVFGCERLSPQRDLCGRWLDEATGIAQARIRGTHLLLPGHGLSGPTLEIFQYDPAKARAGTGINTPGYAHIAFAVDDVAAVARSVREHGGRDVGTLTSVELPSIGSIEFQYVTDPEGNIIELQKWRTPPNPTAPSGHTSGDE